MSGHDRRGSAPQDPSWSPESLADLHAGALDEDAAQQLRQQVSADPAAREVLAALRTTTEQLGELGAEPVPEAVAARIDGALREAAHERHAPQPTARPAGQQPGPHLPHGPAAPAAERPTADGAPAGGTAARPAPAVDLSARRRRRVRSAWAVAAVAAAASVAAVLVLVLSPWPRTQQQAQQPPSTQQPPPGQQPQTGLPPAPGDSAPLALTGPEVDLTGEQFTRVMRAQNYDGLREERQWPGCLRANGTGGEQPLGAHAITLDGKPAQLFVLSTGEIGRFHLLAVGPDCGPDEPATISEATYGG
ncbi:hypothetical protein [Salinifilum ghardaiensis]